MINLHGADYVSVVEISATKRITGSKDAESWQNDKLLFVGWNTESDLIEIPQGGISMIFASYDVL